jgi:hypothetical protein
MIDLTGVTHHPAIEEIVEVLCNKTQNTDKGFFRTEVAYFLGKMASSMRATIVTQDRGEFPANIYALALATSGYGKGLSVNIMENEFMRGFKKRFTEETMPAIAETSLWKLAQERSLRNQSDQQTEFDALQLEYKRQGVYPFTFDSGTVPAVKQLRHKLLLAEAGSINLQIDEIGSNLIGSVDLLTVFLELYDQGMVKMKLTKNTNENSRNEEVDGKTPTNMLLFGTPAKLFDGSQTEDQFYSFLETGYARRCIFGVGHQDRKSFHSLTAEEIYDRLVQPTNSVTLNKWAAQFTKLADPTFFGWRMLVQRDVGIKVTEYKNACERAAELMAEHEEVKKAELSHRYFKALKLAGAYAFIDESTIVTMDHLLQAILLVEQSGEAFQTILNREKTYVKLAKYIAAVGTEVTHADLTESLPFYPKSNSGRNDMITLATAWGYKRHIIVKKTFIDGIEFFRGETLEETSLDKMMLSYSDHWAYNYETEIAPFDQLHQLTQAEDLHWCNHSFKNKHRSEENTIPGFNMLVLDIDGGVKLDLVHDLLREYKFMTYTTKRHTDEEHRFRLIMPINYVLHLDTEEYKEFVNGVMDWLPFKTTADVDSSSNQRAKKWMTHPGAYHYNMEGEIFDALPFIPKTTKNAEFKENFKKLENLGNLERWFANRMASGNRNNHLIRYALALVDSGQDLMTVSRQVHEFNKKLSNSLSEEEIDRTILVTAAKRYQRSVA